MKAQRHQRFIREELQNLTKELPQISLQAMHDNTIAMSLEQLSTESQTHHLEEFADYAVTHPKV